MAVWLRTEDRRLTAEFVILQRSTESWMCFVDATRYSGPVTIRFSLALAAFAEFLPAFAVKDLDLMVWSAARRRDARPPFLGQRQSRISVSVRVWFEALARW
jgi:hypothetical protein